VLGSAHEFAHLDKREGRELKKSKREDRTCESLNVLPFSPELLFFSKFFFFLSRIENHDIHL
jgi:hypothetical protein